MQRDEHGVDGVILHCKHEIMVETDLLIDSEGLWWGTLQDAAFCEGIILLHISIFLVPFL